MNLKEDFNDKFQHNLITKKDVIINRGDDNIFDDDEMDNVGLLSDYGEITLPKGTKLHYISNNDYGVLFSLPDYNNVELKIYYDYWDDDFKLDVKIDDDSEYYKQYGLDDDLEEFVEYFIGPESEYRAKYCAISLNGQKATITWVAQEYMDEYGATEIAEAVNKFILHDGLDINECECTCSDRQNEFPTIKLKWDVSSSPTFKNITPYDYLVYIEDSDGDYEETFNNLEDAKAQAQRWLEDEDVQYYCGGQYIIIVKGPKGFDDIYSDNIERVEKYCIPEYEEDLDENINLKENLTRSEIQEIVNNIVDRMDSNLKDANDETTDIEFEISTTSEKEISKIFRLLNDICLDKYIDYEIENEETYPKGKYYYAILNRKYPDDYYFDYESEETTWVTEPSQRTGKYKISNKEVEEVKNKEIVENMQDKKYIVFNHFNPDTLYFVKNIPDDSWIWDSDWIIEDVTDKHGNCLIENNDENISVGEMGNKTLSDFDKEIIASLKQAIQEDPDEEYLCAYTSEDREFCFEKDELPDDLDSMTPFTDFVEDSYVDGDSNSQYQVINLDTEEFGEFGVDIFVDENEDLEESMRREMINENTITGTLPPSIDKFLMDMSQMYIDDLTYTDISKFGDRFTEDDIKQLKKYKTELSQGFEENDPEIQEIFKNIKNIVKGNLQEAMTNREKLMKRFPELNLNEDAEMGNSELNKQEVLDWLSEHELAWEDFVNYFEDVYQSSAEVPIDEILGWISDHDNLAEDFEYKFGISVYADDCDDDCDWFEDELEEHVAIDVYNQLNSPNILEIKPSKLKESVESKWNISSNKLVATDSQEFANLVDLAKLLQEKSPNKYQYTVEKTYEDFGAGMQWYNIICHDKKGDSWQVLDTKEWLDLANGNKSVEEMYQNVVTDRFFQDTVEKGSIFSMLDKFQ